VVWKEQEQEQEEAEIYDVVVAVLLQIKKQELWQKKDQQEYKVQRDPLVVAEEQIVFYVQLLK
jgi:hypothetical protein